VAPHAPASISASRKLEARWTSGSRATVIHVAAGGPRRADSRSSPRSSGPGGESEDRAHHRLDALEALPAPQGRLHGSASSPALRSMTAWSTALCSGTSTRWSACVPERAASASSEVASYRGAELHQGGVEDALGVSTATATMLDRFAYQMVDRADGIQASLAGKRIFITGAPASSGPRWWSDCCAPCRRTARAPVRRPACEPDPAHRREILKNDCFDRLRAELGDRFDAEVSARITSVAVTSPRRARLDEKGRAELARCDIAIHSAATVSFDAPLDQAVEINMLGPLGWPRGRPGTRGGRQGGGSGPHT